MSNPIDGGPGGPVQVDPAEGAEATDGPEGAESDFAAHLGAVPDLAAGAAELQDLEAAVDDVAKALSEGEIKDPGAAIEAVIERAVALRNAHLAPAFQQKITQDLSAVLLDDPFFVMEVEGLIAHALDRLP